MAGVELVLETRSGWIQSRRSRWLVVTLLMSMLFGPIVFRFVRPEMERRKMVVALQRRDWKTLVEIFEEEEWRKSGMNKERAIKFLDTYLTPPLLDKMEILVEESGLDLLSIRLVDKSDGFSAIEIAAQKVGHLFPSTDLPLLDRIPGETSWGMSFCSITEGIAWMRFERLSKTSDVAFYDFLLKERRNLEEIGMTRFGELRQADVLTYSIYGIEEAIGYKPETIDSLLVDIETTNRPPDPELLKVAKKYGRKLVLK